MDLRSEPYPVSITADRKINRMSVEWSDGHLSAYPFTLLRFACPCAECRGGHENMSPEPDPAVFSAKALESPSTRMQSLEGVGSYGLTIQWEDGHHQGIYNWHYLRALCPCPQCQRGT